MKNFIKVVILFILLATFVSCEQREHTSYYEVIEYIEETGELPENYITKDEARDLGWNPKEGNLWEVTEQKSIGGDIFYNREGRLPRKEGRIYYEADIGYEGGRRGAKRLVYSNDGLYFYTEDHYKTFTELEIKDDSD